MDSGNSGISVIEIPSRGQTIPVSRENVAAFIGPTPRGPADIPVAVRNLEEYLHRFGVPGCVSRMEFMLAQYFENGGTLAVVVRVCRSELRNRITLPAPGGALVLEALHPGPLEHLRASVDYDGIEAADRRSFNLVVHRCRSPSDPLVEEQEILSAISVDPAAPDYVRDALSGSRLVRLGEPPPPERPASTAGAGYVCGRSMGRGDNSPTDYDLIGSREEGTGLFALEQVPWIDFIVLVPGVPGAGLGPVALFAAERYCRERHALLLLDPPGTWNHASDVVQTQRQRGFASANAITYFPPLESAPRAGPAGRLSAAGAIAGRLCAAGLDLPGRLPLSLGRSRPALTLEQAEAHQLGRLGVNTLTRPGPTRTELAGLVTMARFGGVATSWNSLRERRIALFILSSLSRHTRWALFETAGPPLWQEAREQVSAFLTAFHAQGLLVGATPSEAFYVKCDIDTRDSRAATSLTLVIGLALWAPGDYVAFRIAHSADGCLVTELGWQPGLALAG